MLNWTEQLEAQAKRELDGLTLTPRSAGDPEVALERVRALVRPPALRVVEAIEAGKAESEEWERTREMVACYLEDGQPSADPAVEAMALKLLPFADGRAQFGAMSAVIPLLVDHWIGRRGIAFALTTVVRSFDWELRRFAALGATFGRLSVVRRSPGGDPAAALRAAKRWIGIVPVVERCLAEAVAASSAAERAELDDVVAALWARGGREERALLASILGDEGRLTEWLQARVASRPGEAECAYLAERTLLLVDDGALWGRFLGQLNQLELGGQVGLVERRLPYYAALLQRRREGAVPALVGLLTSLDRVWSTPLPGIGRYNEHWNDLRGSACALLDALSHFSDEPRLVPIALRLLENTQRFSRANSLTSALSGLLLRSSGHARSATLSRGDRPWAVALLARLDQQQAAVSSRTEGDPSPLTVDALPTPGKRVRAAKGEVPELPSLKDKQGRLLSPAVTARVAALLEEAESGPVAAVSDHCDHAALAQHLAARVDAWDDGRSKDAWALVALERFADSSLSAWLVAKVLMWSSGASWRRAVTGLSVLSQIGDKRSLQAIAALREPSTPKPLMLAARQAFFAASEKLGLSIEQLAARVAPTVPVDDDGRVRLDLGGRAVIVDFNETLLPVASLAGRTIAAIPKAGTGDSKEQVAVATATLKELKRVAKPAAAALLARLEHAMCNATPSGREDFVELLLVDAYARHAARRLVWCRIQGEERVLFAVERDGTLRDLRGTPVALEPGDRVELPHPVRLDATMRAAWAPLYETEDRRQPFQQLGRATHREDELAALAARIVELPIGRVRGLVASGWQRGDLFDAGVYTEIYRDFGVFQLQLRFEEGIPVVGAEGQVAVEASVVRRERPSGQLDIAASEAGRELSRLAPRGA